MKKVTEVWKTFFLFEVLHDVGDAEICEQVVLCVGRRILIKRVGVTSIQIIQSYQGGE